jgi:hypothetical protein
MRNLGEYDKTLGGLAALAELAPWLLVGFLVLIGSVTVAIYGLPFQSKEQGQRDERDVAQIVTVIDRLSDKINAIATNDQVMQHEIQELAKNQAEIDELRKQMLDQAIHIEGLEADEKVNEAERIADGMSARRKKGR